MPKLTEAQFQRYVIDVARRFGWRVWHVPAPMRATKKGWVGAREAAGLPDLVLIHDDPPRLIFAELKADGGKLSMEQREFLHAAGDVADEMHTYESTGDNSIRKHRLLGVYVWEPGLEDTIETILRSRTLL